MFRSSPAAPRLRHDSHMPQGASPSPAHSAPGCLLLQVVTLDIRNFLNVAPDNATTLHRMIQDNLGPYIWPCCNVSMTLGELQATVGLPGRCWQRGCIGERPSCSTPQ